MSEAVVRGTIPTPLGPFEAVWTENGLASLAFPSESPAHCDLWLHRWAPRARVEPAGDSLARVSEQLSAYFDGRLRQFALPLDLRGTHFQMQVWKFLRGIPYGTTCTYGQIAQAIGRPSDARAVGAANGANPVPVVVPCHRVIGSHGGLTGYGGGIDMKWRLLELEGAVLPGSAQLPFDGAGS